MALTDRFNEVLHWTWDKFWELENDPNATSEDALVCSFIRACGAGDLRSIKHAFARSDGEVEIPIKFNVPKFYVRYLAATTIDKEDGAGEKAVAPIAKEEYDVATSKLRATLDKMRTAPKALVPALLERRKFVDEAMKNNLTLPKEIPLVKSIICANLLSLANRGSSNAVTEVFNQLDGRLAKTITLLGGEDVYVDDYVTKIAPAGAAKDSKGIYVAENKAIANLWVSKIAPEALSELAGDDD